MVVVYHTFKFDFLRKIHTDNVLVRDIIFAANITLQHLTN
ncbi:unnamed protein product [Tenebrio molitor]|nr:unnamed protein product [Tenebrio molitor]